MSEQDQSPLSDDDDSGKTCSKCRESKSFDEFYRDKARRDGRQSRCKVCQSARPRRWSHRDPVKQREWWLRREFGFAGGQADYEALLASQGGICRGCLREPGDGEVFDVDHDRECCPQRRSCGKCVRGLLCRRCNVTLGQVNDEPERLRRLADYIEQWDASRPPLELFGVEEVSRTAALRRVS